METPHRSGLFTTYELRLSVNNLLGFSREEHDFHSPRLAMKPPWGLIANPRWGDPTYIAGLRDHRKKKKKTSNKSVNKGIVCHFLSSGYAGVMGVTGIQLARQRLGCRWARNRVSRPPETSCHVTRHSIYGFLIIFPIRKSLNCHKVMVENHIIFFIFSLVKWQKLSEFRFTIRDPVGFAVDGRPSTGRSAVVQFLLFHLCKAHLNHLKDMRHAPWFKRFKQWI